MSLTSIETVLAEVAGLFDGLVTDGALQANLKGPPLADELEGRSPICSTYYDGSRFLNQGGYVECRHRWRVTLFVNRRGHGDANTETILGQLVTKIVQKARDNTAGTTYGEIFVVGFTSPSFTVVDGVPYRLCEIVLESITHDSV